MTARAAVRRALGGPWLPLCTTASALLGWSWLVVPALPPASWVRTSANVAAALLLLRAARRRGLSWHELGLGRSSWRPGARWGVSALAAVTVGYTLVLTVPALRALLQDFAVPARSRGELAARVLLVIPVSTVLCEEVAFRGVLLATARRVLPVPAAVTVSAAVFGLWHIGPAIRDGQAAQLVEIAGVVAVTTAGGLLLGWLRQRTSSLLAPIGLHLATNSVGLAAAALACR